MIYGKICKGCGETYSAEHFGLLKGYLDSYCKGCRRAMSAERYANRSKPCTVRACDGTAFGRGLCSSHYYLAIYSGLIERQPRALKATVGYVGAHNRVRMAKGFAHQYTCECGSQARDWALQPTAVDVLTDEQGQTYSLNVDDYKAMCKPCHNTLDAKTRKAAEVANA